MKKNLSPTVTVRLCADDKLGRTITAPRASAEPLLETGQLFRCNVCSSPEHDVLHPSAFVTYWTGGKIFNQLRDAIVRDAIVRDAITGQPSSAEAAS